MRALPTLFVAPALVLLLAANGMGDTYYVAPTGKAENDGSREKPWASVEQALAKVGGGNTIVLRPGIYQGPILIAKAYAGTAERPTIIRSEVKWQAVIMGAPYHVIASGDDCHWVVIDGFEVLGARYDGIKMNGDHSTVWNCWVHNNSAMGVAMHNKKGGVIENNLIEFNGQHVQFHHGVYADGEGLVVRNNIVRHNSSFGLHLYPSIRNARVENNLVSGHKEKPGIILSCPKGGGRNVVVNNTIVGNRGGIAIWQGDGEVVANNILVADRDREVLVFSEGTTQVTSDYNLCVPASTDQGPHGLTGDPMFVDAGRGVYWLRPDSPAIGKGAAQYAPASDFWGRPLSKERALDLGCFLYVPGLAAEKLRASWRSGWPYRFAPDAKNEVPDLWEQPADAVPK